MKLLLLIDGSGCYYLNILSIPDDMDPEKEVAEWQAATTVDTSPLKEGQGQRWENTFEKWLLSRGAVEAKHQTFDTRDDTVSDYP